MKGIAPLPIFKVVAQFLVLEAAICFVCLVPRNFVTEQGFFCNDLSIRLPRKPEVVSNTALFLISEIFVLAVVAIVELYRLCYKDPQGQCSLYEEGRGKGKRLIIRIAHFYGHYLIGVLVALIICDMSKPAVGRLRPHFLDVCKPAGIDLDACVNTARFIESYHCTGDPVAVREARLSFFSGHGTLSMLSVTYCVLFLQARFSHLAPTSILAPIVQALTFFGGLLVSYSRYVDHSHHFTDVLTGVMVGIAVAIITAKYITRLFDMPVLPSSNTSTASTRPLTV